MCLPFCGPGLSSSFARALNEDTNTLSRSLHKSYGVYLHRVEISANQKCKSTCIRCQSLLVWCVYHALLLSRRLFVACVIPSSCLPYWNSRLRMQRESSADRNWSLSEGLLSTIRDTYWRYISLETLLNRVQIDSFHRRRV